MFQPDTDSRGNTVKEQTAPPFELVQYTTGQLQKKLFHKAAILEKQFF